MFKEYDMMNKTKFLLLSIFILTILSSTSYCKNIRVTKSGYLASLSEKILDKAVDYAVAKDNIALQKLIDSKLVFLLKSNLKVYIVDTKLFSGKIKIRPVGETIEVWTVTEAVTK